MGVTISDVWRLYVAQEHKCALSGAALHISTKKDRCGTTASLDRIDSTKGYVSGNIQWIHKDINRMKSDFPQEAFLEWCRKIALANPKACG